MVPSVFAETYIIFTAQGSSNPECAETADGCFIPYELHIEVGDTVIFQNIDTASHTFTSGTPMDGPNGLFNSSLVQSGGSFSITFDTAAEYPYWCMVHPWSTGIIIVGDGISTTTEPESTAEVESGVDQTDDSLTMFERKKTDILSSLGYNQGFPYHFGLERDFTEEQGVTKANYQLYKIIDDQTNKPFVECHISLELDYPFRNKNL